MARVRRALACFGYSALLLGVSACTGFVGDERGPTSRGSGANGAASSDGDTGSHGDACTSEADTSPLVLRRLSKHEYQLTLQELFRLAEPPDVAQVPDDSDQGGFRTVAGLQSVSDQHLRAYVDRAASLAGELLTDGERRELVLGCDTAQATCLSDFVARFGKLAYRRELEAEEVLDLVQRAEVAGADQDDRFRYVIEALLASPSFLFRVEVGSGEPLSTLRGDELAARLSFTLWGRAPSETLLSRAQSGELDGSEGLTAVAEEMLRDDRARAFFRAFFQQWLDFEVLRAPAQPPPGFSDGLLGDMIGETERVLSEFAWDAGTSLRDALTANFTYVTPALGAFYGLDVSGEDFVRVEFPADHPRANTGLLTHASLISSKSDGDLIAVRGKWLRNAFLCQDVEVPAALLDEIQGQLSGLSYLEVVEKRNSEASCAGCHSLIDPIGVGFAQYDAIGYHDGSVDPLEFGLTPRLEGADPPEFGSIAELSLKLQSMPELGTCVAEKVFVYTQGRFPTEADHCTLEAVGRRFEQSNYRFAALLQALVESPAFRLRRAP